MSIHTEREAIFTKIGYEIRETLPQIPAPEEAVYVCSFWLFYCDFTILGVPCFAYNTIHTAEETKWSPPEWYVDVDDSMVQALTPYYQKWSEKYFLLDYL